MSLSLRSMWAVETICVKRSLLNRYPDTMLGIASTLWSNDEQNNEPFFLDRNGDRFPYIIDYMKDQQKIVLPFSVTKESFVNDLQFYGFDTIILDDIVDQSLHILLNMQHCIDIISTVKHIESVQNHQHNIMRKLNITQEERVVENLRSMKEFREYMDSLNKKVRDIYREIF